MALLLVGPFIGQSVGQGTKPKVALVLSGGGAKGLAHIPLLQLLDSLGLVPDLVIGTSMGSVVRAFIAEHLVGGVDGHLDIGGRYRREHGVASVFDLEVERGLGAARRDG